MEPTGNAGEAEQRPLLEWLLRRHADTPRTRAKQWILAGRVSVAGRVVRRPHETIPDPGPALRLLEREASGLDFGAGLQIHPRVSLLHLDGSLAVVNKGPGLISVPGASGALSALGIVQDFVSGSLRGRGFRGGQALPPALRKIELLPVHRLDQYTSGVFCLAASPAARADLIDQVSRHTMEREYLAFCLGRAPSPVGTWRNFLELSADESRQRVVTPLGRGSREPRAGSGAAARPAAGIEAVTHFQAVGEYVLRDGKTVVTVLRLRLETGRKHQVRVQATHAGLPLIGDRLYHPDYARGAAPPLPFERQALHAARLTLQHPATGVRLSWEAPLPPDLARLQTLLEAKRI